MQTNSIAIDNDISENVTIPSTTGVPSCPFAAMPNIFPALKIAAIRIPKQFVKAP
ncbi:MAG: hypothetical protein RLZZ337_378 [Bacteroidota bacterium]